MYIDYFKFDKDLGVMVRSGIYTTVSDYDCHNDDCVVIFEHDKCGDDNIETYYRKYDVAVVKAIENIQWDISELQKDIVGLMTQPEPK